MRREKKRLIKLRKINIFIVIFFILSITTLFSDDIEMDTDGDGKNDRWLNVEIFKAWKKIDINKNDKPDESCLYVSDRNKIYFIKLEKFDYSGKGKPNIQIRNKIEGKNFFTEIEVDENMDGNIDFILYKKNDVMYMKKSSNGTSKIFDVIEEYDSNGLLVKESVDINKDGIMDDANIFNNNILIRQEIDSNFDKAVDIWVHFKYKPDNTFEECIIEKDNNFDGKADEWHTTNDRRQVIKIEKDTDFDGKVDEIKDLLNKS